MDPVVEERVTANPTDRTRRGRAATGVRARLATDAPRYPIAPSNSAARSLPSLDTIRTDSMGVFQGSVALPMAADAGSCTIAVIASNGDVVASAEGVILALVALAVAGGWVGLRRPGHD